MDYIFKEGQFFFFFFLSFMDGKDFERQSGGLNIPGKMESEKAHRLFGECERCYLT